MQKKLLVIDDEQSILDSLSRTLSDLGFELLLCNDPVKGLEILKNEGAQVVLTDLKMPVMDGETFLQRLRKTPEYANIPVIILTNLNKTEAPKTLWHLGISAYVVKAHTTPSEIVASIRELVS